MSTTDREVLKLRNRIRRLRGQLDAVERGLTSKEDCADVLMLLAAVRGGVNGLMAEVMEDHIRHHLAEGGETQRPI
ncbi:MAG: metal/formaldehyde-sensitive transcriptional repressor, partial [Acidobacteria bacterium]|nr:metal/formaldehyde-sensitive transcriptional repressor [Acidobacteriota bacterium]